MLTLTTKQEAEFLDKVRKDTTEKYLQHLITNGGANATLSLAQAAGYLNITTQTLRKLPIPSYDVTGNGGSISYKVADLDVYMEKRRVK